MNNFSFHTIATAAYRTIAVVMIAAVSFWLLEPTVSRAITDDFTVSQVISGAISFQTNPGDITMVGTLDGLTGGTSYGTTTTRVRTNNATGYNMTIQFSSTTAMGRNGGGYIPNFVYSTSTDGYPAGFDISSAGSQFGFSVNASNTADISPVFTHSGSACGTTNNVSFAVNNCWRGASSTDETFETELINTSVPTPGSGSTSTVQFRITIPSNPTPAVPNGTYVATATLTAIDN